MRRNDLSGRVPARLPLVQLAMAVLLLLEALTSHCATRTALVAAQTVGRVEELQSEVSEQGDSSDQNKNNDDNNEKTENNDNNDNNENDNNDNNDNNDSNDNNDNNDNNDSNDHHVEDEPPIDDDLRRQLEEAERIFQRNVERQERWRRLDGEIKTWAHSHFEALALVPTYPCMLEERFGNWGDGGKWVCLKTRPSRNTKDGGKPVLVSVGNSDDELEFLEDAHNILGATPHSFDPNAPAAVEISKPFLRFRKVGVVGSSEIDSVKEDHPEKDWAVLPDVLRMVGTDYGDIFKMDCEGCEFGVIKDLVTKWGRDDQPFGQIMVEIHCANEDGEFDPSKCGQLLVDMHNAGYRLFHVETNPYFRLGYELAFVHERRVKP